VKNGNAVSNDRSPAHGAPGEAGLASMAELIRQHRSTRLVPAAVAALALAVLGASIFLGTDRLRRNVRTQMVNRDGELLYAVALARQFASGAQTNLSTRLQSPAEQLALALDISQLKDDVLAVRLFDAKGQFVTAFPPYVSESALTAATLAELRNLRPRSRYLGAAHLTDLFLAGASGGANTNVTPLLEVNIPIHLQGEKQLLAAAQLVLDARPLETEFARLDESLWLQALAAFVAGGGLLLATLLWAYRRLEKSHALLRERTARLLRANHELTLAAKTGALGAVTAHLVHGLSNPLANLQDFVASRGGSGLDDHDWQDAITATGRMQKLVHEVVRVLGEEGGVDHYEITLAELADILAAKVRSAAQDAGVQFVVELSAEGELANRHANLVLLILENLLHNAFQVTPRGQRVRLSIAARSESVTFAVADAGPGFPPHLLKDLFAVCRSTQGGSGLGLAISRQLARHLGAQLELQSSTATGCVFTLTLPRALLAGVEIESLRSTTIPVA
jgi:signal transduction histidine kinase